MKRFILLAGVLTVLASASWAQRVLYSSEAINQPEQGPAVKKVRQNWVFSPKITVKYADGSSGHIPKDSIWGYEDRRGRLYRYYKNEFYRVRKADDLVYYSIQRSVGQGVHNHYYFSQNYDTPLRWTKRKARHDAE